jgi:hypothetical protein
MDNFYITLISNNSSSTANQPANFRTYLPHTLQLRGQWECSLAELSFMKSWNNIDDLPDERSPIVKQTTFMFWFDLDGHETFKGKGYETFDISTGHYTQVNDLITNFNENYVKWASDYRSELERNLRKEEDNLKLAHEHEFTGKEQTINAIEKRIADLKLYLKSPIDDAIKMGFDNIKKRITMKFNQKIILAFNFSTHLNYMLGFKDPETEGRIYWDTLETKNGIKIAEYPVNLNSGANSLYVYTDVVEPNIVSNKMARLLRIVNGAGEYGNYISVAYTKPYYMPVFSSTINSIEIEIKDEMDRNIRFSFGITIALLHFRKKKLQLPTVTSL